MRLNKISIWILILFNTVAASLSEMRLKRNPLLCGIAWRQRKPDSQIMNF